MPGTGEYGRNSSPRGGKRSLTAAWRSITEPLPGHCETDEILLKPRTLRQQGREATSGRARLASTCVCLRAQGRRSLAAEGAPSHITAGGSTARDIAVRSTEGPPSPQPSSHAGQPRDPAVVVRGKPAGPPYRPAPFRNSSARSSCSSRCRTPPRQHSRHAAEPTAPAAGHSPGTGHGGRPDGSTGRRPRRSPGHRLTSAHAESTEPSVPSASSPAAPLPFARRAPGRRMGCGRFPRTRAASTASATTRLPSVSARPSPTGQRSACEPTTARRRQSVVALAARHHGVYGHPVRMITLCNHIPDLERLRVPRVPTQLDGDPAGPTTRGRARSASAVEHRPTDVVAQPLVIKYQLADRPRELIALPLALESSRTLALALRCRRTCGLDRIGGRAELMGGDMGDGPGLPGGVRGMPCCPTQVSGCPHRMAARRASLHHLDFTTHPGPGMLDRLTRSRVPRPGRSEEAKDVLCAGGSP